MVRRGRIARLSATAVGLLVAGCGPSGGGVTSAPPAGETAIAQRSTSGASATETPANDPTGGAPAVPVGTAGRTAESSGDGDLVLVDVRVAEHDSFDRIVLEFNGTGVPGWAVNYVDEAVLDGSGETVPLGGDAILDIYASGTTYPETSGTYCSGPQHFVPGNGGDVNDVWVGGTFEGYTQLLAGIDGAPTPFRVFALTGPSRLVVDVVDASAG